MRILIVYCHPCPDSFTAKVRDTAVAAAVKKGHEVDLIDLYAEEFDPVMSAEELRGYHDERSNRQPVAAHIERIARAEALLFVYPTWWYGLPAMLKGWLDRVMVPGFAFGMPTADHGPRPLLRHIRLIGALTTCGATPFISWAMSFPGRRTLLRGVRSLCHPFCRTRFLALYRMDSVGPKARDAHLARVAGLVGRL